MAPGPLLWAARADHGDARRAMKTGRWVLAAALWSQLWGCAGGSGDAEGGDAVELFCSADCSNAGRCGFLVEGGCGDRCRQYNTALAIYSSSYMEATSRCLRTLSCAAISGDGYQECFEQATGLTAPTATTRAFCDDWVSTWFECGSWLRVTECEQDFARFSAQTLQQLAQCEAAESCQALSDCVVATWEWL